MMNHLGTAKPSLYTLGSPGSGGFVDQLFRRSGIPPPATQAELRRLAGGCHGIQVLAGLVSTGIFGH